MEAPGAHSCVLHMSLPGTTSRTTATVAGCGIKFAASLLHLVAPLRVDLHFETHVCIQYTTDEVYFTYTL